MFFVGRGLRERLGAPGDMKKMPGLQQPPAVLLNKEPFEKELHQRLLQLMSSNGAPSILTKERARTGESGAGSWRSMRLTRPEALRKAPALNAKAAPIALQKSAAALQRKGSAA